MTRRLANHRATFPIGLIICGAIGLLLCTAAVAGACPFCNAVKPTLAQQRDASAIVVLAEAVDKPSGAPGSSDTRRQTFRVHSLLKGGKRLGKIESLRIVPDAPVKEGSLSLLLGSGADDTSLDQFQWTAIPLDETAYAYVFREPALLLPSGERLKYFARYLENRNPLVAGDSLEEFAHASFDDTVQAARTLSMADLRRWLVDPQVPPERKGFYGLALGLAPEPADRRVNEELLHRQIVAPASDFRAGFDGVLGGYMLLTGRKGLDLLDNRYFANPKAAIGDVQHAMRALRFYHQFGHGIDSNLEAEALSHALARPEFAADATMDLARWQYWPVEPRVAAIYTERGYGDAVTHRAIVGYLKACPKPEAAAALAHLRSVDPQGIAEAEKWLEIFNGAK
ncbi:MAG TPA: hypothetical protein VHX65_06455 [Pirellulales bacterium]|jgi:hypothetical protein|nr:hypothetical protein [Pirellulales bacterium]